MRKQIMQTIRSDAVSNDLGGKTIGYVCDADAGRSAFKSAELAVWPDVSAIAHDVNGRQRDRPALTFLKRHLRKNDIILISEAGDISRYARSQHDFMAEMEAEGVTVTVLDWTRDA